jgi:hypothetical protein
MMGTTHALTGLLLGASSLYIFPEMFPLVGIACMLGSIIPDFDMPFDHRKTMHFTEYFTVAAVLTGALVPVFPITAVVLVFYGFLGAAVHCWMDALGGGLERRPWKRSSERGVYLHTKNEWVKPRRWIRYDGAPEDFLLGVALAVPSLMIYTGRFHLLIYTMIGVSGFYAVVRKKLPDVEEILEDYDVFRKYWRPHRYS